MDKPLINRVANSNLKLINLENYYPETEIVEFDLKPLLFKELILRKRTSGQLSRKLTGAYTRVRRFYYSTPMML